MVAYRSCDGPLTRAHLIPKKLLKSTFPLGAYQTEQNAPIWLPAKGRKKDLPKGTPYRPKTKIKDDPRLLVDACMTHHHHLDFSRKLRIPRESLPESVEQFAIEYQLVWWLDREYGEHPRKEAV